MNKKIIINYTNNKKINEMIENRKKLVKVGFTLGVTAIFSEIGATIYAPDPIRTFIVKRAWAREVLGWATS